MVLLSFDIEEFDMPLEYKGEISFEKQIEISRKGLISILDLLKKHNAKATFFSTVIFAKENQDLIKKLLSEGHELASHTWFHSKFEIQDLENSRLELNKIFGTEVTGLRMPRMMNIDSKDVLNAGYSYNSSINPTYLPGRYDNRKVSRTYFKENNLLQIPASVSTYFRVPLFWLSFHNFPFSFYKFLVKKALKSDKYVNLYFHPWEFSNIKNTDFNLPKFTTKNTGNEMIERFDAFLSWLNNDGETFSTFQNFIKSKNI
ncbi:polysaccharide deacetylase family protein [Halpernia sp.]|uniref:polysaccharide deacetylase family protein n=1 Tax=Halpernia sp. TaxID=2782209 RepID=UPI003A9469AC